jgi:hypothetical protein
MGRLGNEIDDRLRHFVEAQRMFFVATAPLAADGHVNVSPKGLDTLRIVSPTTVAYLDFVGSGAETIAHVRENGRIVIMVCAFNGSPRIVRLHGVGVIVEPHDPEYQRMRQLFPAHPAGGRAIVMVSVERISDSCGFGVPLYEFKGDRPQLPAWAERKGEAALAQYQRDKNATSIDGLPALEWVGGGDVTVKP